MSSDAKACPRCGAPAPKRKPTGPQVVAVIFAGLLVIGAIRGAVKGPDETSPATPEMSAEQKAEKEKAEKEAAAAKEKERLAAACAGDRQFTNWECFMSVDALVDAQQACKKAVSSRAKIDVKWEDGFFTRPFVTTVRDRSDANLVRMGTDRVQMQNGFGNWVRHRAVCEWNVSKQTARIVLLEPGSLKN